MAFGVYHINNLILFHIYDIVNVKFNGKFVDGYYYLPIKKGDSSQGPAPRS
jgi:hypothetical protein